MFNNYPYTDFHELNLDWILKEMKALDARLDEALTTLSTQIYNKVMTDLQPTLTGLRNDMNALTNDFSALRGQFKDLDAEFDAFKIYVDNRILYLQSYVDAQAAACNEYTNNAISENNIALLETMETYLSQIKVINFFTGQLVSIQSMFDYLAGLHTTDSLDFDTMAARNKTYTELAAFNKTYTELVMNGNTWYV